MYKVPILVVAYHRVEYSHDLFVRLRAIQPEKLYVSIDGPEPSDHVDYRRCLEVRSVFMPEWHCDLQLRYSEVHQGKAQHVVDAISWFFSHEPEGIILFDDTLPSEDFFHFCETMLDRYRDVFRISHISGCNILKKNYLNTPYYFSAYPLPWGFATWKTRWADFDLRMKAISEDDFQMLNQKYQLRKKVVKFWLRRYRLLVKNQLDIWEYQYFFHFWKQNRLAVIPSVNLVENRGFSCKKKRRFRKLNREVRQFNDFSVNENVSQFAKGDQFMFRKFFKKDKLTFLHRWLDENIFND